MTEENKTCDFYNEKICTLFSKYFGFNVECENLSLSTIDSDIERECPIKRLEQYNEKLKKEVKQIGSDFIKKGDYARELEKENKELKCELEQLRQSLKN